MNNEEFERRAEFIRNQQAAASKRLQEAQARTEHSLKDLKALTTDGFKIVIDSFQNLNSKFEALVDAQIRTEAALNRHLIEGHNSA